MYIPKLEYIFETFDNMMIIAKELTKLNRQQQS